MTGLKPKTPAAPAPFPARRTLRSGADLAAAKLAAPESAALIDRAGGVFPVAVTPHLAAEMAPGDALTRQFIPEEGELARDPDDRSDPIGDAAHSPVRGIVHRYPDRLLLTPLLVCPAYCRFCFRREHVAQENAVLSEAELDSAFAYIESNPQVWEVILSGGDPLMLPARRLAAIVGRLDAIPHVAVIRIHTRVPVLDPARVTSALIGALQAQKAVYAVLHCNHARELATETRAACSAFVKAGIPMLSQTVLLAGVNDDAETLAALMRALVASRIKPYYLHHPDLAPGTAHFRVPLARGRALMRELRGRLSGLCQPEYVLDIPGGFGKVPVGPDYAVADGPDWLVTDWRGRTHAYPGGPRDVAGPRPT